MLVDPLTGVPAGLLTIVTVYVWLSTPEKYHYNNSQTCTFALMHLIAANYRSCETKDVVSRTWAKKIWTASQLTKFSRFLLSSVISHCCENHHYKENCYTIQVHT